MSSQLVTHLLNSTTTAIKSVVPFEVQMEKPTLFRDKDIKTELGVVIGITGDIKGTMYLTTKKQTSSSIAEKMYGVSVEGDMLTSFQGEFGNMISGNISRIIYSEEVEIDITPPTVVEGKVTTNGHKVALKFSASILDIGEMDVILTIH
jgi:chemotaxis protein CheX